MTLALNTITSFLKYSISVALLFAGLSAMAQQVQPLETVANRPRPALDPLGIRLSGFILSPDLSVQGTYNDNIFAHDSVTVEDIVVSVLPSISLESNWNRHSLSLNADADIGRYQDNSDEDYEDYEIRADGRLDINSANYLSGFLRHAADHVDRTSPEDFRFAGITEYTADTASLTYFRKPNRFLLQLNGRARETLFEDSPTPIGSINNADRNRFQTDYTMRIGYEFVAESVFYLQGTANSWDYQQKVDNAGFERSSNGYEVAMGISREISGVTSANVYVGYLSQEFDDGRFETVEGLSFGADIIWNVTNLMTLNATASRNIEPTAIVGASGIAATYYGMSLDYELLRNWILSMNIFLADDEYQGIGRTDNVVGSGLSTKYLIHRNFYAYLGFDYERRESTPENLRADDYRVNRFFLRLQGQF